MRIVYIEDNLANLALVERIARVDGHNIINYRTGEMAVAAFPTDKPDLVLVDIHLAGLMGGVEVVKKLRDLRCNCTIIVMTAYTNQHERAEVIAAGADKYMPKPVPVHELLMMLRVAAV